MKIIFEPIGYQTIFHSSGWMGSEIFSQGFLDMQQRRRRQKPPARNPQGSSFTVTEKFWDDIFQKKFKQIFGNLSADCLLKEELLFLNLAWKFFWISNSAVFVRQMTGKNGKGRIIRYWN
jgi:hypothetical protein